MKSITIFLMTILVQSIILAIVFIGFLLDPLLGLWVVGIYFFGAGTFLMYQFIKNLNLKNCSF
ncbi:hypothetical protein A8135_01110 [Legionella jamestowniensis]|uniref:Uncharacterized protein n=1 Tax=Legionella jamestowniensis TaxID=455 RepID=A0ABX2XTG8_9GAMM|nr:hypothetical protein A8135_01110 [Legionella jamestowniensis]